MGEIIVVTEETDFDTGEQAQLEEIIHNPDINNGESTALHSVTRLLVGGALEGWTELQGHIKSWEAGVEMDPRQQDESPPATGTVSAPSLTMRYAMIGLMFNAQDRWVRRSKSALKIANRTTNAFLAPVANRLDDNSRLQPARSRFEKLVKRGESVASRWVDRGRHEEAHSRKLVRQAAQEGFNSSMDQLGQAPALQDLVRKQSVGLTQEVVDEVRARTVTADMLAENVARSVLRRTPRGELPPPPTATPEVE